VLPSTATTPIVFSSTAAAVSAGSRVVRPSSIGTIRASTSQKLQNFGQQTCTWVPNTMFGRPVPPRSRHRRSMARPASMAASELPLVEQPMNRPSSSCHRFASALMHSCSMRELAGYSSRFIRLIDAVSA
jgi:hypothetical protein